MQGDRVVPEAMDAVPIARLEELLAHLAELRDPETPIDARLFDEVELQLNDANIPPLLDTVLLPLTQLLRSTSTSSRDPGPLLSMTAKLLGPLTFSRVLTLADSTSILTALRSPLPSANLLALTMLHKAARGPDDAALLSTLPDLVAALLTCWLDTESATITERAARVLGDLLKTDCDVVEDVATNGTFSAEIFKRRVPGHGHLWNLIFGSEQLFAIIPRLCRFASPDSEDDADSLARTERQSSLAQGRLLRLLPRLAALNLRALSQTLFPELVPLPQNLARETGHGLLQWAALAMIDMSDLLMHYNLIDFFQRFVSVMRVTNSGPPSTTRVIRALVRAATANDDLLKTALTGLPDTMVEDEAEPLRTYIGQLLD
ncbi:hypothetical protein BBO_03057 [Beauveria brongniartii RCEF 3172]|uniref:DNA mismatch repair protein HSM3 N-terminal domain-containing protein n=1 Tax=Beauveria brongniartii RCEF 3172 TaxID=1081107 RepID=A0A167GE01_9HYPO|nr:hypothetical protein BBO_03057 [Beauveria brongniartii RCEF 3172]